MLAVLLPDTTHGTAIFADHLGDQLAGFTWMGLGSPKMLGRGIDLCFVHFARVHPGAKMVCR